ncbi:MAG: NfeD family protein [Opitutaceae bacterium]|jgi:membrane-bound serine protease (ClpP class)
MTSRLYRSIVFCLFLFCGIALSSAADNKAPAAPLAEKTTKKVSVVIIPVREQIADPVLYIIRRGLKEAIANNVDVVVLDMKTPGGSLATTFEIMEALAKFPGNTITYVNSEAISAGAFISATTREIWFSPDGVIGAAAPVMAGGQDVEATMKQKIVSYLKARIRSTSEGKGYRGQVISAMIDSDYELKIGDKVIKSKGELLSLTASEACDNYGEPPKTLLGSGIAKTADDMLTQKYGASGFVVLRLEATWSEQLAVWLNAITPVLLGLGVLALFIEFKTPGFGFFGIAGIVLLAIVFLGNYVAGLSGNEPILVFALGLVLVAIEIFFLPGIAVLAVAGLALMFGSLVWSMADLWPHEPLVFSGEVFVKPLVHIGLGLGLAVVLGLLLARFLPKGMFWDRMILGTVVPGSAQVAGVAPAEGMGIDSLVGRIGTAATDLRPVGQVEIDGRRYEAKVDVGFIDAGSPVVIKEKSDFGLIVEKTS